MISLSEVVLQKVLFIGNFYWFVRKMFTGICVCMFVREGGKKGGRERKGGEETDTQAVRQPDREMQRQTDWQEGQRAQREAGREGGGKE